MAGVGSRFHKWSVPPRLTWLLLALAAIALLIEGLYAVVLRDNDYRVHFVYGIFFLEGSPFQSDGATAFYPLPRLWMNASLASFDYHWGRFLCYVTAVLSLGLTFRIWSELAHPAAPLASRHQTAAIGWTVAVLVPFLIRDFDECGLQLLLLFFLTAAAYAFAHGQKGHCGFWLGTAIAYKATPLLFLPLLVWKREWRTVGWTIAFTIVLSLLPATYLGWTKTIDAHRLWGTRAVEILRNQQAYPSVPGIEQPKPQNVSLKALIARYTTSYPPGHPLHVDHPLFVQFGNLPPRVAPAVVTGTILLLGAVIAWRMRRRWQMPLKNPNFAPEWAVACLFTALMSPLCWRQHLVMVIPCTYLAARERLSRTDGRWRRWVPVVAACIFLLSRRTVLGTDLAHVVLTYKLDTLGVLSFAFLSLTLPEPLEDTAVETGSAENGQPLPQAA